MTDIAVLSKVRSSNTGNLCEVKTKSSCVHSSFVKIIQPPYNFGIYMRLIKQHYCCPGVPLAAQNKNAILN